MAQETRKPTQEQQAVIDALRAGAPSIEVGSFAGTGKTTLAEMTVESMPKGTKFLYIVFGNKNAKEAKERFERFGEENVVCKTVDALALANFPRQKGENVDLGHYKRQDVERLLGMNFKEAKKTLEGFEEFCNSDALYIENPNVQALWDMMEIKKLNPSFSFIKKSFHLNLALNPKDLPVNKYGKYDVILMDEYQDTNPVTLAIAQKIAAKSYLKVGDQHQSIYGFRGASNAMGADKGALKLYLSNSFRFNQSIADKANAILSLYKGETQKIIGLSTQTNMRNACMISRTNSNLIHVVKKLYEGKIPFKTIREASALFDLPMSIHSMQEGKEPRDSCKFLKWEHDKFKKGNFGDTFIDYLKDSARQNRDIELSSAVKITEEIPFGLLGDMEKQTNAYNKQADLNAQFFLSSIHTAKGLEWDYVKIGDDTFDYPRMIAEHIYGEVGEINTQGYNFLEKFREDVQGGFVKQNVVEEFNLLYVALTRAKVKVEYSPSIAVLLNEQDANNAVKEAYDRVVEQSQKQEEAQERLNQNFRKSVLSQFVK